MLDNMKFGEFVYKLRKEKNITQQHLAEILDVSYQAISRWENNITSPDITVLPILSNIFNVTIDYLLDNKIEENDEIINETYKQYWNLFNENKYNEAEILLEEKIKKFPNNYFLKNELLKLYYVLMFKKTQSEYQNKIIKLANEIIDNTLVPEYKFSAIQTLILIYGSKNEFEKGKELLELLPDSSYSKDHLKEYTLNGEEKEKAVQEQTDDILSMFEHILYMQMFKKSIKERPKFLLKYKELLDLIYEEKDYGLYNYNLSFIYLQCSKEYSKLKNEEKTLNYLDLSIKHLLEYFNLKEQQITIKYTSFMVNKLEDNTSEWPLDKKVIFEDYIKTLEEESFNFLKQNEIFKKLQQQLL